MSKRFVLSFAAGIAVLIAMSIAGGGVFLAEGSLHPRRRTPAAEVDRRIDSVAANSGAQVRSIFLTAPDGTRLHAYWLRPQAGAGRAVLIAHGVGDSATGSVGYAPMFLRHGYAVLLPESRGHGESGGLVTYGLREAGDVRLWLDWMRRTGGVGQVYGLGESLGGSILLDSLEEGADFNAIVAECAYSSFPAIARERAGVVLADVGLFYTKLKYGVDLSAEPQPVEAVAKTHVPILLIHGLADWRTQPRNSLKIARAGNSVELWLVPGAGHVSAYAARPVEFEQRVLDWFRRASRAQTASAK